MFGKKIDPKTIPEVNIGVLGHVDHGKTTLTQAITGKMTDTHSEEIRRGISIRLGYADTTFYKCKKCDSYSTTEKCPKCFGDTDIQRTVSFVDTPGHESLMAVVLTGSSLIDGAILIIAANEKCPSPQTREHMTALDVVGIKNIIIVQNKVDLVKEERVKESYKEIKEFIKGTVAENSPIIPVSAMRRVNIEYVIEAIENNIPTPKRDLSKDPKMYVARSFDVNKPGSTIDKLVGGVIGGSIIEGELKKGQEIELRPGIRTEDSWKPLKSKIISMEKGGKKLDKAGAGGLLGMMTPLDPALTKADGLVGNIVGLPGKLPESRHKINLEINLLERVVGAKEEMEVENIKLNEPLMINIGTGRSVGVVTKLGDKNIELTLKLPICAEKGERIVISRQIRKRWRLIGYGILKE
ncbi:MAG: translation initiation factor IF-2 subunit gamma [Candidatus Aenigmarchaeota archaeon]|nr:translation initiation factor IF-2 subunit gamma [Candidatus Aenigmarchaeota archaeon]